MKLLESKKLHYGKFLYRLSLTNIMAPWFRTEFQKQGDLKFLKSKIDEYQVLYDLDKPLYRNMFRTELKITNEEFIDSKFLYKILTRQTDYKIRVERLAGLNIYSNNFGLLDHIGENLKTDSVVMYVPAQNNIARLLAEKNVIFVDKEPTHPIKVTFNYKKIDPSLANWISVNKDKITAGKRTIENISMGFANSNYVFIRDERVLSMLEIIAGQNIQRIEKLVFCNK